ncbi:MAG: glycosyltransferase [Bacteroidaceae bacterium]|nr:glycosyltransferase [Bacteroidaceae bacterium]
MPKYSIIIPVFNRPDEVDELLTSLEAQGSNGAGKRDVPAFEVIVVEDGSTTTCEAACRRHAGLDITYLVKANGGPGPARNYGAARARGEWLIVLDSDVILPPGYLQAIETELATAPADAFGGPDRAHPAFTPTQKAINYAMTSAFTTGGIRGGSKKGLDRFFPRSFNMGVAADLWRRLGGFRPMRFGEDIDFSYRIVESGARCRLMPGAWVWHKRRTSFRQFFRQVRNSGAARINLALLHPGTMKPVHTLPALFTIGLATLAAMALAGVILAVVGLAGSCQPGCNMSLVLTYAGTALTLCALLPPAALALLFATDAAIRNRSLRVGLLAAYASFIQLTGYGSGFISAFWRRIILRRKDEGFDDNKKLYA